MKDATIDGTINATIAKQYTDWHIKTGGFARDMTLRDHFAGLAMQGLLSMRPHQANTHHQTMNLQGKRTKWQTQCFWSVPNDPMLQRFW
jgi:hypothetical protein